MLSPTITLAALPHVASQPLAYLYLSQIPYTGLDLGPIGTVLYWLVLVSFALAVAYLVLFDAMPIMNRSLRSFGSRVSFALNAQESALLNRRSAPTVPLAHSILPTVHEPHEAPRGYSSYDGFKSFARNGALSIEDIVKGLSKKRPGGIAERKDEPATHVEPIYEHVEPIYEHVEAIAEVAAEGGAVVPPHIRGFAAALVEGDRAAVFAGLRQHLRGGGAPEQLITSIVCLLDDTYRARIDGTPCDQNIARLTARLDTPTLERLITALTTAIDASYSTGVTGAKLALTRALTVLGA